MRSHLLACAATGALLLSGTPAHAATVTAVTVVPDTVTGADATYRWAGETCGLAAVENPLSPNVYTGVLTAGPWAVVDAHQIVVSYDPPGVDAGASSIIITCALRGATLTFTSPSPGPVARPLVQPVTFTWNQAQPLELCTTVSWVPGSTGSPYVHGCVLAIVQQV